MACNDFYLQSDVVFNDASSTPAYEEVDDLVFDLTVATSPVSTGNITLFPTDLNITNTVVSDVLNYLTTTAATPQPGDPLPFNEVCKLQSSSP